MMNLMEELMELLELTSICSGNLLYKLWDWQAIDLIDERDDTTWYLGR